MYYSCYLALCELHIQGSKSVKIEPQKVQGHQILACIAVFYKKNFTFPVNIFFNYPLLYMHQIAAVYFLQKHFKIAIQMNS